jgi:Sulfotransferase family
MSLFKNVEIAIKEIPWRASRSMGPFTNPAATTFFHNLLSGGHVANELIKVLPRHKLVYVAVPKAASTRIRKTLAAIEGRFSRSLRPGRRSCYRGPYGLSSMMIGSFYDLATHPETFRFSFVRNPYARMVSCWADKFANKPLAPGDAFIDEYLAVRRDVDPALPAGADRRLSFADFVVYVTGVAGARKDIHLQAQHDILDIPGFGFNFIGRVESFGTDFMCVLDYLRAGDDVRREAQAPANESRHDAWPIYYTSELAGRIYRAYERDFDRFGYPRAFIWS